MGTNHIAGIERGDGDGTTDDRGGEDLLATLESELDHGVFGAFQCLHNLLGGQRIPQEAGGVRTEDAVARLEPCSFARPSFDDAHHDDGIQQRVELDADARKGTF